MFHEQRETRKKTQGSPGTKRASCEEKGQKTGWGWVFWGAYEENGKKDSGISGSTRYHGERALKKTVEKRGGGRGTQLGRSWCLKM